MKNRSVPLILIACGLPTLDATARNVVAEEVRFADQFRRRLEHDLGESLDADEFKDVFEGVLLADLAGYETPTGSQIRARTLPSMGAAFALLGVPCDLNPQWPIDYLREGSDETIAAGITMMVRQEIIAHTVQYDIGDFVDTVTRAAEFTTGVNQRTVNFLLSRDGGLRGASVADIRRGISEGIAAVMRPQGQNLMDARLERIAAVLAIDVSLDLYPDREHEHDGMMREIGIDPDHVRRLASGLARMAETDGHDADETWMHCVSAIARAFGSTHLGRPAFEMIPAIAKTLDMRVDFDVYEDGDPRADAQDHAGMAPYVLAVLAATGAMNLGPTTIAEEAQSLVEAIELQGLIHEEDGLPLRDELLDAVEEAVIETMGDEDEEESYEIRLLDETTIRVIKDMDADELDFTFASGPAMPSPPTDSPIDIVGVIVASGKLPDAPLKRVRKSLTILPVGTDEHEMKSGYAWCPPERVVIDWRQALAISKAAADPAGVRYAAILVEIGDEPYMLVNDGRRTQLLGAAQMPWENNFTHPGQTLH